MEWPYATSGTASCQAKGAARSSRPGAGSSKQNPEFMRAGVRRVGQPPYSQRHSRKTFPAPPAGGRVGQVVEMVRGVTSAAFMPVELPRFRGRLLLTLGRPEIRRSGEGNADGPNGRH